MVDADLRRCLPGGRCDGLRQNVGEAGEKIDVVPAVIARPIGADLKYAVRLVIVILDDDVDDRDDAMRGIERRQFATIPVLQITHDRRFTGREGAPLRRSHIGTRHDMADDRIPAAMAGDDDKIVLLGAILPNLAEGHAEAVGAGPRRLGQDFRQIRLAECEAAEAGDSRLLAQQPLACCSGVSHWRMVRRAAVRPAISSHGGSEPSIACSATEVISTRISSGVKIRSLRPSQIVSKDNRNTLGR